MRHGRAAFTNGFRQAQKHVLQDNRRIRRGQIRIGRAGACTGISQQIVDENRQAPAPFRQEAEKLLHNSGINQSAAENAGLKISSKLLNVARPVAGPVEK